MLEKRRIDKYLYSISDLPDAPSAAGFTALRLKSYFDGRTDIEVKNAINGLIEDLTAQTGAGEIGARLEGVAGGTVQALLQALYTLIGGCYTKGESDSRLNAKLDRAEAGGLVEDVGLDPATGVISVRKRDGTELRWDTALEKIALDARLDGTDFVLTLADGTAQRVPLAAFADRYRFEPTDTVSFEAAVENGEHVVRATVRDGALGLEKLTLSAASQLREYAEAAGGSAAMAQGSRDAAEQARDQAGAFARQAGQAAAQSDQHRQAAQEAGQAAALARDGAEQAGERVQAAAGQAETQASAARAEADRAKREADRAGAIVGGDYLTRADIVDSLDSEDGDAALSARQGRALALGKADLEDGRVPASQLPSMDYVPLERRVNGRVLTTDIALTAGDVGARPSSWTPTAADVGARPSSWTPTAAEVGAVPAGRRVNGKPLTADVTLTAGDVGARPSSWTPTAADVGARPSSWTPTAANVGAVPTGRRVNGKPLTADIALTAADVGADPAGSADSARPYYVGHFDMGEGTVASVQVTDLPFTPSILVVAGNEQGMVSLATPTASTDGLFVVQNGFNFSVFSGKKYNPWRFIAFR